MNRKGAALAISIAVSVLACGDDTSPAETSGSGGAGGDPIGGGGIGTDPGCFDYESFDATTPAVTFAVGVLPIFQRSCGISVACHQDATSPPGQPFLGPQIGVTATPMQIQEIFDANLGVPATLEPGMPRISAGDPARSFFMHKLDGTFTCPLLACAAMASCGNTEPLG